MLITNVRISNADIAVVREKKLRVTEVTLSLDQLPTRLNGYRIMQLSDFHYGFFTRSSFINYALNQAATRNPDLLVLTGDYVQLLSRRFSPSQLFGNNRAIRKHQDKVKAHCLNFSNLLQRLNPQDGMLAVWGNHDHLEGRGTLLRNLSPKIQWLENEQVELDFGDFVIQFFGIDDLLRGKPAFTSTFQSETKRIIRSQKFKHDALEPESKTKLSILLSHNPDVGLHDQDCHLASVNLVLSGHTHGGQIRIPKFGPIFTSTKQNKHISGLSRDGNLLYYVNDGIGQSLLPFRAFCEPEITLFVLEKG